MREVDRRGPRRQVECQWVGGIAPVPVPYLIPDPTGFRVGKPDLIPFCPRSLVHANPDRVSVIVIHDHPGEDPVGASGCDFGGKTNAKSRVGGGIIQISVVHLTDQKGLFRGIGSGNFAPPFAVIGAFGFQPVVVGSDGRLTATYAVGVELVIGGGGVAVVAGRSGQGAVTVVAAVRDTIAVRIQRIVEAGALVFGVADAVAVAVG